MWSFSQLLSSAIVAGKQPRQYLNKQLWLCFDKTLFTKPGRQLKVAARWFRALRYCWRLSLKIFEFSSIHPLLDTYYVHAFIQTCTYWVSSMCKACARDFGVNQLLPLLGQSSGECRWAESRAVSVAGRGGGQGPRGTQPWHLTQFWRNLGRLLTGTKEDISAITRHKGREEAAWKGSGQKELLKQWLGGKKEMFLNLLRSLELCVVRDKAG